MSQSLLKNLLIEFISDSSLSFDLVVIILLSHGGQMLFPIGFLPVLTIFSLAFHQIRYYYHFRHIFFRFVLGLIPGSMDATKRLGAICGDILGMSEKYGTLFCRYFRGCSLYLQGD